MLLQLHFRKLVCIKWIKKCKYVTNNEYKKIDNHRDNIYNFSAKEKDMQIAKKANPQGKCKIQIRQSTFGLKMPISSTIMFPAFCGDFFGDISSFRGQNVNLFRCIS